MIEVMRAAVTWLMGSRVTGKEVASRGAVEMMGKGDTTEMLFD